MRGRRRGDGITLKTDAELRQMRRAGLVVRRALDAMTAFVRPGVTTREIDAVAVEVLREARASSSFLAYEPGYGEPPYPAVSCLSRNDVVVHGIPSDAVLRDGDILSIDFGAIVDGFHGDAAVTVEVGAVDESVHRLVEVTREALWRGIGAARLGGTVGDVSAAVEASVRSHPATYGIVRDYTGHGIGRAMHEPPDVPNRGRAHRGPVIRQGMAIAIEPMVTLGTHRVALLDDDWGVVTDDGSWAAHWENTITVTARGLWVLTELDGWEEELARRGLPFGPLSD